MSAPPQRTERPFELVSEFEPKGDQPRAIRELVEGLQRGDQVDWKMQPCLTRDLRTE